MTTQPNIAKDCLNMKNICTFLLFAMLVLAENCL
jgi:hypothetical protein